MSANDARAVTNNSERLSWAEICKRYPDEWVVMIDVDWVNDTDFEFGTASVLGHFKRRKEATPLIKATFVQHEEVGCFWTGKIGPISRFIYP